MTEWRATGGTTTPRNADAVRDYLSRASFAAYDKEEEQERDKDQVPYRFCQLSPGLTYPLRSAPFFSTKRKVTPFLTRNCDGILTARWLQTSMDGLSVCQSFRFPCGPFGCLIGRVGLRQLCVRCRETQRRNGSATSC